MGEAILVKREPLWTKEFVALILANLCMFLGFQMLIPTLPVYVKEIGGTSSNIGFVVGMFTVAALFVRPLTGNALQKFSKKIILMIGTAICLLAMGSYLFASTIFLLLAVRILHGAGFGITTTTYGTVVSDLIPQARRGEGMGYFGLSGTIAMALGPLIGLWLMQTYNFTILFLCALSCTIVSLILTKLLQIKKSPQPPQQTSGTFLDGFIERKALLPSLLILCITLMYGGIGSFITLFATEVGIADISLFFLFNALAIAVTRPFSGKLYDAKGHAFVIIPGVIITFAGIILLSYTTTIPSLIIAAACYGSGFGAIQPALQAWMIDRVAPHRRGVATATFFSAFDLGIGAGAIIFGFIAHFTNYATVYRYSSLLLIAFLFIYITSIRKQKHGNKNREKAAG
ncbi:MULTISPECIES: MFS transporter [Bacillus]|uniref:Major facilitator family transporter n=2 Tax=Bacillus cereus group TaxID=86661 RepID=A0A164KKK2_BACCE|nr:MULTISPECIES: MFS transporter [Bacillus]KXY72295.1 MFS transporter [Bacillus wiedmannii]KZD50917.1 major facilitator family transporter [Bacillus cereus]MED4384374.1 MFS transporter [Bacillus mobilis]NEL01434.1 MFS transporter [Bacillus mobilis]PEW82556.1 MFS transporter [Bacillus cereus]